MSARLDPRTRRLGTDPVGPLLLRLGLPGMASMFFMALYNVINTFWVAKLGPGAIAATTVVAPYQLLVMAVGVGTGTGFGSIISRRFGEQRPEAANRIAGQAVPLALAFGLCFWTATTFFPDALLRAFGTTPDIWAETQGYLVIIGYGAFFALFSMMANNILRGAGNTTLPMAFMALGTGLNIILDPLLIYGIGPFPALGVPGASLATVLSQGISGGVNAWYLISRRSGFHLRRAYLVPAWADLRDIYQVGLPAFIMQFAGSALLIVFNQALAVFGSVAIAANGLVFRTSGLIMMPIAGIAQGLMPFVGYNLGAGQLRRLWQGVRFAALGSAAFITVGFTVLQLFPTLWVHVFTNDPVFVPEAVQALRLAMLALPLIGPQFMWITTFQGLGRGNTAMIISLLRQLVLLLPLLLVLPRVLGLNGVWLSVPIADSLSFFITFTWILAERRRQLRVPVPASVPLPPVPIESAPKDWVD